MKTWRTLKKELLKDKAILSVDNNFTIDTYNKIAKIYTNNYFNDKTDLPFIDKFLKLLPKDSKILDVGCGPGQFTKYMISKGFNVTGIDLSSEMINIAKERVPKGKFFKMDMKKLKFGKGVFDGILSAYSLIHIHSSKVLDVMKEFYRILKVGGYLMIIVQKGEANKTVDEPLMKGEKTFINFFTQGKLRGYLKEAGFKTEYMEGMKMKDPDGLSDRVIYVIARK